MRAIVLFSVVLAASAGRAAPREAPAPVESALTPAPQVGLDADVWRRAERAYHKARADGHARRARLVVIDYSRPSTEERLWVFDMERGTLLFKELVAHGKNTGDDTARSFSNQPGSLKTSLGVFVTDEIYWGDHGKSLRLDGLEPGFNDRARERAIVIHGAPYVDASLAHKQGRLGRSWGCPAVRDEVASRVIDAIAHGAVVFAWGPDPRWQQSSAYLR